MKPLVKTWLLHPTCLVDFVCHIAPNASSILFKPSNMVDSGNTCVSSVHISLGCSWRLKPINLLLLLCICSQCRKSHVACKVHMNYHDHDWIWGTDHLFRLFTCVVVYTVSHTRQCDWVPIEDQNLPKSLSQQKRHHVDQQSSHYSSDGNETCMFQIKCISCYNVFYVGTLEATVLPKIEWWPTRNL